MSVRKVTYGELLSAQRVLGGIAGSVTGPILSMKIARLLRKIGAEVEDYQKGLANLLEKHDVDAGEGITQDVLNGKPEFGKELDALLQEEVDVDFSVDGTLMFLMGEDGVQFGVQQVLSLGGLVDYGEDD